MRSKGFGQALRVILTGHKISPQTKLAKRLGRTRADGRQLQMPQSPQVASLLFQSVEKEADPVTRGEDKPLVLGQPGDRRVERTMVRQWQNLDARSQEYFRAHRFERSGRLAGPPRAGE